MPGTEGGGGSAVTVGDGDGGGAVTALGDSGAGPGLGGRGLSGGLSGLVGISGAAPGDSGGLGGGGGAVVVGFFEAGARRGGHVGNTELWASSSIWAMALSRLPDGSPAITCARSDGRMSLTPSILQLRLSRDCSGLMRDNSFRSFRHPSRKGS